MNNSAERDKKNALEITKQMLPALTSFLGVMVPDLTQQTALANILFTGIAIRSALSGNRAKELDQYLKQNGDRLTKMLSESESMRVLVWNLIEKYLRENSKQKRQMILNAMGNSIDPEFRIREDWHSRFLTVLDQINTDEATLLLDLAKQEDTIRAWYKKGFGNQIPYKPKFIDQIRDQEKQRAWLTKLYALGNYGLVVIREPATKIIQTMREADQNSQYGITPSDSKIRELPEVYITPFGDFFCKEILIPNNT
ncbi:MAG: DUF4393 domain-containing protein [Candidatus Andersenbacteria bacterium]|nr:DUF4393 domain-containing protein [Candidatus Andersenbacteria bacterium]